MQKKQLTLIVVSLLVVVLSVSLAYFTTQIIGKGKNLDVSSTNLQIVFTDSDGVITGNDIEPGWSDTKTFTVQNNSKSEYKYNIVIKDLVNTFVTEGYLQYKITSTNNGYNMTNYVDVPKYATATDTILAYSASIPVGVTQSYTIEFRYVNDENVDQSIDMNKVLKGTLFITEGTVKKPTLAEKLLIDNPTISERTDFSTSFKTNTTNTLYKAKENGTDVYYFSGVENVDTTGCEYNGENVKTYGVTLDENNCTTGMTVCLRSNGVYMYTGTGSCETNDGEVLTGEVVTINAQWTAAAYKPINNWVKFGGYYWRIIRTNSDGGVRLLYHGTSTTAADAYIGTSEFNSTSFTNTLSAGYMYGTEDSLVSNRTNTNSSTIKTAIDNWYAQNMTSYTKYLSTTAVYCNDRSYDININFGAHIRLDDAKQPNYDCGTTASGGWLESTGQSISDMFTVPNDKGIGNQLLTYPIALMTADEISYAGGRDITDAPMWYYTNSLLESSTGSTKWWSMSPSTLDAKLYMYMVYGSTLPGRLNADFVNDTLGVRPVLSLKSCVKTSVGDGSASNPYTIEETESGC